jgi:hypothetical protein
MLGLIVCLVVALAATGPLSKAAFCMAVLAGLTWLHCMVDFVCRHWFMHAMTLHDLIRPREHSTDSVVAALMEIDALCQAAGAAPNAHDANEEAQDGTQ